MIIIKTKQEIEYMRRAGIIVAEILEEFKSMIRPGMRTLELDIFAEEYIRRKGAIPAFKGYRGYPASICTSINDEVVHGIPGERVLMEGDIISIDVGVIVNGYYGDAARTYPVGKVSNLAQKLIKVTENSFYEGIKYATINNRLYDISAAIQRYVESNGFSVVRDYSGHGIGQRMHEDPQVPNFGVFGKGPRLRAGMVLAIEPMVNAGSYEVVLKEDNWTVVTYDGSLSAHYENTVAITEDGPQILTII